MVDSSLKFGTFTLFQNNTQAAFNQVAKIVAEHGHPCLDVCCPADEMP